MSPFPLDQAPALGATTLFVPGIPTRPFDHHAPNPRSRRQPTRVDPAIVWTAPLANGPRTPSGVLGGSLDRFWWKPGRTGAFSAGSPQNGTPPTEPGAPPPSSLLARQHRVAVPRQRPTLPLHQPWGDPAQGPHRPRPVRVRPGHAAGQARRRHTYKLADWGFDTWFFFMSTPFSIFNSKKNLYFKPFFEAFKARRLAVAAQPPPTGFHLVLFVPFSPVCMAKV